MCCVRSIGILLLLTACETGSTKGDVPPDELCDLASRSWEGVVDGPDELCGPEDLEPAEICFSVLDVHVQPVDVLEGDRALEMMVCLFGEVTYTAFGVTKTETLTEVSKGPELTRLTGMTFVNSDDGTGACVGLTAGIDGLSSGFVFFDEDAYWWEDGTNRSQRQESATGEWSSRAELFLGVPDFLAPLTEANVWSLSESDTKYWEEPECGSIGG